MICASLICQYRIVAEWVIFLSHIIWRFRHREILREAKKTGQNVDDLLAKKDDNRSSGVESVSQIKDSPASSDINSDSPNVPRASTSEDKDLERGPD